MDVPSCCNREESYAALAVRATLQETQWHAKVAKLWVVMYWLRAKYVRRAARGGIGHFVSVFLSEPEAWNIPAKFLKSASHILAAADVIFRRDKFRS